MRVKKPSPQTAGVALLAVVGLALIGFGVGGYLQKYRATHNPQPKIQTSVVIHSTDKPDETPPRCDDSYQVAANQPREIELPSINTSGCIQRMGIDQKNNIAAPPNIHLAGWYVNSAKPGETGVSIIDGHVQGRYEKGIFKHLDSLNSGDKISIKYGNGQSKRFEVVSVDRYSAKQAGKEQYKTLPGVTHQLTLITCGGNYNSAAKSYDQRIIVRTKLLQS